VVVEEQHAAFEVGAEEAAVLVVGDAKRPAGQRGRGRRPQPPAPTRPSGRISTPCSLSGRSRLPLVVGPEAAIALVPGDGRRRSSPAYSGWQA
jgi:hypothetical protein